jgi:hypothetical protein
MEENYCFEVHEKINHDERANWKLYVDAVYKADSNKKNMSAEVLSKLLGVKTREDLDIWEKLKCPNWLFCFQVEKTYTGRMKWIIV